MADDTQAAGGTPAAEGGTPNDVSGLPEWAQKRFADLEARLSDVNKESASRRHRLNELETTLKGLSESQQKRLAEQGNYEELARQRAAEVETLKPYEERAKSLEGIIRASNEARVGQVREDLRALVPGDYAPEKLATWLDANWQRLTAKIAPDLDAGAGAASRKAANLSEDERATARRFGMTDEQYISAKAKAAREG
jgi:hypothetical protein